LGDGLLGGVVVPSRLWIILAKFLAGEKLDHLSPSFSGLLNRLEEAVVIEREGLAADGETVLPALVRDWLRRKVQEAGQRDRAWAEQFEIHGHRLVLV